MIILKKDWAQSRDRKVFLEKKLRGIEIKNLIIIIIELLIIK